MPFEVRGKSEQLVYKAFHQLNSGVLNQERAGEEERFRERDTAHMQAMHSTAPTHNRDLPYWRCYFICCVRDVIPG